ncbi:MAG: hypothetical protein QXW19_04680 [Candidatus Bathyarchaeia archaeon]
MPKELRVEGVEERLFEICQKNDVVFMALFGSFVRGNRRRGAISI